jgi:hypothetical protein
MGPHLERRPSAQSTAVTTESLLSRPPGGSCPSCCAATAREREAQSCASRSRSAWGSAVLRRRLPPSLCAMPPWLPLVEAAGWAGGWAPQLQQLRVCVCVGGEGGGQGVHPALEAQLWMRAVRGSRARPSRRPVARCPAPARAPAGHQPHRSSRSCPTRAPPGCAARAGRPRRTGRRLGRPLQRRRRAPGP